MMFVLVAPAILQDPKPLRTGPGPETPATERRHQAGGVGAARSQPVCHDSCLVSVHSGLSALAQGLQEVVTQAGPWPIGLSRQKLKISLLRNSHRQQRHALCSASPDQTPGRRRLEAKGGRKGVSSSPTLPPPVLGHEAPPPPHTLLTPPQVLA